MRSPETLTATVSSHDMLSHLKQVAVSSVFDYQFCDPDKYDATVEFSAKTVEDLANTEVKITLTKRPDTDETADDDAEVVIDEGMSPNLAQLCG